MTKYVCRKVGRKGSLNHADGDFTTDYRLADTVRTATSSTIYISVRRVLWQFVYSATGLPVTTLIPAAEWELR